MANQTMGLIGRKLGMTQLYREDGDVVPVTVIQTGPCVVTQVKTEASRDHYNAVQLAFGDRKVQRATRAELGHLKKAGVEGARSELREFRVDAETAKAYEVGKVLTAAEMFREGDRIDVCGTSKGRGFSGVMKRHNFAGFERSHGAHEYFRHGGSIGTRLTPGMTLAGMPMSGHMGSARVTVQNLVIARVDAERNLVFVHGGVPGPTGAIVTVRKAVKNVG
jgi:large subunit ribosomal protein L3